MRSMFAEATTFKQNLCDWGPKLTDTGSFTDGMFDSTNCRNMNDPSLSAIPPGPFCYQCE
jgi:hypothetical protein